MFRLFCPPGATIRSLTGHARRRLPRLLILYFFSGFGLDYPDQVGNVICSINPIQSAIYSVIYQSAEDVFSATEMNTSSPITFSTLINNALVGLGGLISDSQNFESNLFAETVLEFALKSVGSSAESALRQSHLYLSICEQMIQGIIEYEVCPVNYFIPFLHLIVYHLTDDLPSVDLFNASQSPFLLQSHRDRTTEIRGIWLVHDECQHLFFDSHNNHQPGRLGRSLSGYDHRKRWWLHVSSVTSQTCLI